MKYGIGVAALVAVLVLTGASYYKFGGEQPAPPQSQVQAQSVPRPAFVPSALLAQDEPTNGAPEANGEEPAPPAPGATLEVLSLVPDDGGQACPTGFTLLAAFVLNGGSITGLMLDGVDVTAESQITPAGAISFRPSSLPGAGMHEATATVTMADGTVVTHTWMFEVTAAACAQSPAVPTSAPQPPAPPTPVTPPGPGGPPATPAPSGAPAGPALGALPTQGFLHLVADHSWISPTGETQRATPAETWLNLANGDARTTEKDPANGSEISTTIRRGESIIRLMHQDKRAMTQVFPDATPPQLNETRDTLLGYRVAYEQGRLQFAAEETIDGMPALRLTAAPQGESGGLDVWLRKDYGLILREIAYRRGSDGGREPLQTHVVTYRTAELLPSVAENVLTPSIPSDWMRVNSRLLTPQMAATFRDFDLHWLGTEYQGNILVEMSHETVQGTPPGAPPGAPTGPTSFVVLTYAPAPPAPPANPQAAPPPPPSGAAGITIFQRQSTGAPGGPTGGPNTPPGPGGQPGPGGPPGGEQVTVNGNRGTIITLPPPPTPTAAQGGQQQGPPPTPPTIMELTIGGTQVTIQGRDRASVMAAATELRRVTQ